MQKVTQYILKEEEYQEIKNLTTLLSNYLHGFNEYDGADEQAKKAVARIKTLLNE